MGLFLIRHACYIFIPSRPRYNQLCVQTPRSLAIGFPHFSIKKLWLNLELVESLLTFDLLKIKHTLSVETSVTTYPATQLHITEERLSYLYRCKNLQTRVILRNLFLIKQLINCYNFNRQCHCTCNFRQCSQQWALSPTAR